MALKGLTQRPFYCDDPRLRPQYDIDLYCPADSIVTARESVGKLGYEPIRPAREWRPGLSVSKRPPSEKRVHLSYSFDEVAAHANRIKDIRPEER